MDRDALVADDLLRQRLHLAVVRNTRRLRSALVALALGRRLLLDLDLSSLLEEEELVQSLLQSDLGRAGAAHLGFYSLRVRRRHLALEDLRILRVRRRRVADPSTRL